ncbi:MAG: glycosyltransferase, partial [Nitrospiraceae bacterium]
ALSIIVPTYHEAENLPELVGRISSVVSGVGIETEIVIVVDNSQDGTDRVCKEISQRHPVRLIIRRHARGLATAVLHGIKESKNDYIIVMDADLSHPPVKISVMVKSLQGGADFVVGSRYVQGGSTDARWGFLRWVNSKAATVLARGLTDLKDPMAGYFGFPRRILHEASELSPVGYKIGLEILVKAHCRRVIEIPISFVERTRGQSKLTLAQQALYLRHLRRLYRFRFPQTAEMIQFLAVGASGVIIDLVCYVILTYVLLIDHQVARAASFVAAASWNWFLNRWFTFVGGRQSRPAKQWLTFLTSACIGFVVNWGSYKLLTDHVAVMAQHHLLAFFIGIFAGTGFNYTLSRLFVFRPFDEATAGTRSDRGSVDER